MRHSISPCSRASHDASYEKAVFHHDALPLRATLSGVPVCQVGCPLDFLAGSEENDSPEAVGGGVARPAPGVPECDALAAPVTLQQSNPDRRCGLPALGGNMVSSSQEHENAQRPSRGGQVEHRCFTRYTLKAAATVWREGARQQGEVLNISLGGALIRVFPELSLHEAVTVSIHDSARVPGLMSDLPATVVRTSETDCAVRFEPLHLERGVGDTLPATRGR